jgi:hypothetical protein
MWSAESELDKAMDSLGSGIAVRKLGPEIAAQAVRDAEAKFVEGSGYRWWWEHFTGPYESQEVLGTAALRMWQAIVPDRNESLLLIAAEEEPWPVYEGTAVDLALLLADCPHFEYYITPKSFEWLIAESHHNVVYSVGEAVASRMRVYSGQPQRPAESSSDNNSREGRSGRDPRGGRRRR